MIAEVQRMTAAYATTRQQPQRDPAHLPRRCASGLRTDKFSGVNRDRTGDLLLAKRHARSARRPGSVGSAGDAGVLVARGYGGLSHD